MRTTDASGFGATPFPYLDEIRLGAFVHQVGGSPNEHGADVNAEILFGKIGAPRGDYLLDYFLRPRIHLGADINVTGYTSVAYTGLTWDMPLTSRFFLETSFGGAIHDGNLDQKAHYTALGCRVNFREVGLHRLPPVGALGFSDHRRSHVERRPLLQQSRPHRCRRAAGL